MAACRWFYILIIVLIPAWVYAATEGLVDSKITAEVILDGMTHFDADQGLKDYKVNILEVTRETGKTEVTQRNKVFYFMAPNVYLTMVGEKPETLSNDASFMFMLSQYELKREGDVDVRGEKCFKVVATPRDTAYKKYTKTYYVSKKDYRKMRIESVRSEMEYEFVKYQIEVFYKELEQDGSKVLLVDKSEAVAYDVKGKVLMEQVNSYNDYKFNVGLTQSFFEGILKEYNVYFSDGT